jgi:hypothetical protein
LVWGLLSSSSISVCSNSGDDITNKRCITELGKNWQEQMYPTLTHDMNKFGTQNQIHKFSEYYCFLNMQCWMVHVATWFSVRILVFRFYCSYSLIYILESFNIFT